MEAIVGARLPAKVAAVISNRADAPGLKFAAQSGIPAQVVDEREFSSRGAFDAALEATIERHSPDLVALAGFMRILGGDFARHYSGRMVNIHPSLLPAFPGLHTQTLAARVLRQEHRVYPLAIRWFVEGRLAVENGVVHVDGSDARQALLAEE